MVDWNPVDLGKTLWHELTTGAPPGEPGRGPLAHQGPSFDFSGALSPEGVTVGGKTVSWDYIRSLSPTDTTNLLTKAGLNNDQVNQVMSAVNDAAYDAEKQGFSLQQIMSSGGGASTLEDVDKATKQSSAYAGITGAAPGDPAAAPTQTQGALSAQGLQTYLQNFVNPLIQQQQTAIAGDMSFWKDAINKVGGGYPGMADTMKEEIPMMQNLYQQLARENVTSQALSPYLNIVNNQIASAATVGEAARGLGSTYQSIAQAAASSPSLNSLLNTSGGLGGLTGAQSLQSLIGNITQAGQAGAPSTVRGG